MIKSVIAFVLVERQVIEHNTLYRKKCSNRNSLITIVLSYVLYQMEKEDIARVPSAVGQFQK